MLSIYVPTFNHEKYIRDALEGFIKQKTNFGFEVLVHDDASTDKTPEIIKEYAEKYNLNMKMGVISSNNVIHCNRARYDKSQEN